MRHADMLHDWAYVEVRVYANMCTYGAHTYVCECGVCVWVWVPSKLTLRNIQ